MGDTAQIAANVLALKQEIALLREISHPNIVRYISTEINKKERAIDIVQEYVPGGSVRSLIDRFGPLDERIVKIYTKQILEGLKYLHARGIVHRNLKCSNILVDNDATVKLSDFGASKRISFSDSYKRSPSGLAEAQRTEFGESLRGSSYWMAPEVIANTGNHKAGDVWSLGCVIVEMRTGKPPWSELGPDPVRILNAIATSTEGPPIPPDAFSPRALACVLRCFQIRPELRPTMDALLQDSFLTHQDEGSDSRAREVVQQMSTKLREENAFSKQVEKEKRARWGNAQQPEEQSVSSSVIMDGDSPPAKVEQTIQSKVAQELLAKEREKQEETKRVKEEQRKKWEEELRKELERNQDKKV